ncbi:unnamed protein product [Bathycoccus prasinos]
MSSSSSAKLVRVSSWNVAAINDNPFEYYVTIDSSNKSDVNDDDISDENGNDDDVDALRRRRIEGRRNQKNYEKTMEKIDEKLIKAREHEVKVKDILSKEMLLDVKREIMNMKIDDSWTELEKILSDFLLDGDIGAKRLCSMPDRLTTKSEKGKCRPCVTTSYADDGVAKRLKFLDNKKYPAITDEEVKISRPLQMFCLAAFDKSLIRLIGEADANWAETKKMLVDALVERKVNATIDILERVAKKGREIICLQEVSEQMRDGIAKSEVLTEKFDCLSGPDFDATRNQNSIVLASKTFFESGVWEVVSVNKTKLPAGVASGDLCVVREVSLEEKKDKDRRKPFAIASFHGDTNGLQTVDVVKAVNNECGDSSALIFALDANCHHDDNKGKRLSVETMYGSLAAENLQNCWGDEHALCPTTTCNARSFLQPQLNKAVFYKEKLTSKLVDRHPKDHLFVSSGQFKVNTEMSKRVNDASEDAFRWVDDMPFPTLSFPSDHALVSFELEYNDAS